MIIMILIHSIFFLLSDIFHQIICHQSYLYYHFYHILPQYCPYFLPTQFSQFEKLYIISQSIFIIFTYLISFIRLIVITHIYPISFIIFFLNIVYIFLRTQFYQFQNIYICIQYLFLVFTNLISFIRFLVINNIYLIFFIRLYFNTIYISFGTQCSHFRDISSSFPYIQFILSDTFLSIIFIRFISSFFFSIFSIFI